LLAAFHDLGYQYDDSWNLLKINDNLTGGTLKTFAPDGQDQLLGSEYAYEDGRLVRKGDPSSPPYRTFTYDVLDRLTSATLHLPGGSSQTTTYGYDPFNRLVVVEDGSGKVWRQWSGWQLAAEKPPGAIGAPATPTRKYYSVGAPMGHVDPGGDYVSYDEDPRGTRVLVERGPGQNNTYEPLFDAFGNQISGSYSDDSPFQFQGQEWRDEAGLYYLRNRWYDPELARFTTPDPIVSGILNNYQFALNRPTSLGDPLGLLPLQQEQYLRRAWAAGGDEGLVLAVFDLLHACTTTGLPRALLDSEANGDFAFPKVRVRDEPNGREPLAEAGTGGLWPPYVLNVYPSFSPGFQKHEQAFATELRHLPVAGYDGVLSDPRLRYWVTAAGPNAPGMASDLSVAAVAHELFHAWLDYPAGIRGEEKLGKQWEHNHLGASYFAAEVLGQLWSNETCLCP